MAIEKVSLGYWYQRTTLHLSELYDFLEHGTSPLALNKHKLKELRSDLQISDLQLHISTLESIHYTTHNDITVTIYEDGLILLDKKHTDLKADIQKLTHYFEESFTPAISYLFSLGAPVPKELAGIKTISPFFITLHHASKTDIERIMDELDERKYYEIIGNDLALYRGNRHFLINTSSKVETQALIESQIFFKEFKSQLHHYLNLHRSIWEKIAKIKEQGAIQGKKVQDQRNDLESYKKTIELIDGRMNQMGIHITTRTAQIKSAGLEDVLTETLQFKYENLKDTHQYVKTLWTMTKGYVDSAIQQFNEINALSTKNSIQALTLITTLGLLNGIIGYMTITKLPNITSTGISYLVLLIAATWFVNQLVVFVYKQLKYKINNIQEKRHI